MTAFLEKVARGIAGQIGPEFDELPRDKAHKRVLSRLAVLVVDHTQADLIDAARAALEAMREPSEAMVGAAWGARLRAGTGEAIPIAVYQAMIDKALNDA